MGGEKLKESSMMGRGRKKIEVASRRGKERGNRLLGESDEENWEGEKVRGRLIPDN